MTETIIDGETFNIIVEGQPDAPAILLAHSLGTNLHLFDHQVAALKPHFRLVRYDLRGHGGSQITPAPYSLAKLGRDALAVLDALKIDKVDLIGASAGGLVSLWLLRHAPERIGRAVLANTAARIGTAENWNERIRIVTENGVGTLAPALIENWFTRSYREQHPAEVSHFEETAAATSVEGYAGASAALRDADLREDLREITHPVLVIVGRHDPVTPPGVGALVASSIPNAKLVTLEAAHLSAVEAAEAFNDAVLEFLLGAAEEKSTAEEKPAPAAPKKPRVPRQPKPKAAEPVASVPEKPPIVSAPKPLAKKSPTKKSPARKAAVKKRVAKKAVPKKKAVAKKATAKKTVRKLAAKKRVARKAAVKKSSVRKAAIKKRPVKKVARKATPKKSARKVVAKRKVAAKRTVKKPVRKTVAKKSPRKVTRRRAGRR
ncbi:3-oxoadipate enol-lactonase [Methylovirgula ligni]|uniref:3-oxoadipate enol-lactonase n=1 Tax=Methylovirgula ligni TaxID=569860 RepID=A0A3D9YXJ0_9HYPH|nr:3-oxoadipate enol-lactonase [Methylovirgula ligni]REF86411.1 3-oxoadipate enol-lactonase [Methylovirgula ligni]